MLSLITLFVVMVGNDWALITDAYTDATSKFLRIYFFLWFENLCVCVCVFQMCGLIANVTIFYLS